MGIFLIWHCPFWHLHGLISHPLQSHVTLQGPVLAMKQGWLYWRGSVADVGWGKTVMLCLVAVEWGSGGWGLGSDWRRGIWGAGRRDCRRLAPLPAWQEVSVSVL